LCTGAFVFAQTYNDHVITRGIRAFMARDWRSARLAKDDYWGRRVLLLGPVEAFRIADELRRQVLLLNPGWPHADDRRQDLIAHVRMTELLHRASSARRP
jgi:hypothetical protein